MMNCLKIKVRTDSLENWITYNPVLREDELAAVKIRKKYKFKKGDGIHPFTKLPFLRALSDIGPYLCIYPESTFEKITIELHPTDEEN